jgi:hypothetical protein
LASEKTRVKIFVMTSDLPEVCDKLQRDAGARKVMLCAADGEVMAHAGQPLGVEDGLADAIAQLAADIIQRGTVNGADDVVITLKGTLQACAAPAGRAALIVIFDGTTSLDRVRTKMRRARSVLEKSLEQAPKTDSPRDPS